MCAAYKRLFLRPIKRADRLTVDGVDGEIEVPAGFVGVALIKRAERLTVEFDGDGEDSAGFVGVAKRVPVRLRRCL